MATNVLNPSASTFAPPRRLGRRIGAVFAGLAAVFVLSFIVDSVLHATGVYPPWFQPMSDGLFVLALGYRLVINAFGGYLVARLAPDRPMTHALVMGGIGFVFSLAAAIATWNQGPEFGPHWYPIALVISAFPCAWVGGRLRR